MVNKKTITIFLILFLALVSFTGWYFSSNNYTSDQVKSSNKISSEQYKINQQYEVTVYKSPTCGCCTAWVEAIEKLGYRLIVHDDNEQLRKIKKVLNIPLDKQSCHTSVVEGYILEGHIHPDSISRLLREKKKIKGLYLPGMVVGSVGMEQGDIYDRYAILSIDYEDQISIYDIYN